MESKRQFIIEKKLKNKLNLREPSNKPSSGVVQMMVC